MINKIKSNLKDIVKDIEQFYEAHLWHFLSLNGVRLDEETIEIQWIFYKYGQKDEPVVYYIEMPQNETVPSVTHILPSAEISQREIVDMFGIKVQGSEKGLYLDEDFEGAPFGGCTL